MGKEKDREGAEREREWTQRPERERKEWSHKSSLSAIAAAAIAADSGIFFYSCHSEFDSMSRF